MPARVSRGCVTFLAQMEDLEAHSSGPGKVKQSLYFTFRLQSPQELCTPRKGLTSVGTAQGKGHHSPPLLPIDFPHHCQQNYLPHFLFYLFILINASLCLSSAIAKHNPICLSTCKAKVKWVKHDYHLHFSPSPNQPHQVYSAY